jgi:hypothetical protein
MSHEWSFIDIHLGVLRRLWRDFPELREAMAEAMSNCGSSRTYVARTKQDLYKYQSAAFAERYGRELVDGWFVDTNLNRERMQRILPMAVRAGGLRWGGDVRVYWRPTRVPCEVSTPTSR